MNTTETIDEQIQVSQRNSISLQFARVAATQRDTVALQYQDRDWTYAQLDLAITAAAVRLRQLDLQQGDRVAVMGKNSDTFLMLFLAASRAGLVHVPINFALTGPELEYLVTDSQASVLIVDDEYITTVESISDSTELKHVVGMASMREHIDAEIGNNEYLRDLAVEHSLETVDETDLAQLLYTSGTTSAPKGAMLTHRALLATITAPFQPWISPARITH